MSKCKDITSFNSQFLTLCAKSYAKWNNCGCCKKDLKEQIGKVTPCVIKGKLGMIPICFECSDKIKENGIIEDLYLISVAKKEVIAFILEKEPFYSENDLNRKSLKELESLKDKIVAELEFNAILNEKIANEFVSEETEFYLNNQYDIVENEDLKHELQFEIFFKDWYLWDNRKINNTDKKDRYATVNAKVGNKYFIVKLYLKEDVNNVIAVEYTQVPKFPNLLPIWAQNIERDFKRRIAIGKNILRVVSDLKSSGLAKGDLIITNYLPSFNIKGNAYELALYYMKSTELMQKTLLFSFSNEMELRKIINQFWQI